MHFTCIFSYFPLHFLLIFYLIKTFFCTCTLLFESIFDLSKKVVLSDMFYEQYSKNYHLSFTEMKSEKKLAFVVFDEYFMTQLNFLIEFFLV